MTPAFGFHASRLSAMSGLSVFAAVSMTCATDDQTATDSPLSARVAREG